MADNYVETFEVTDTEDNHYTVKAKDPEAVETAGGEVQDTIVTYDNSSGDSIESFTDFIDNFVSGTKIGRWFKNFKAGVQYILHVGTLVNNCVSDNTDMPLAAAQGKVLMDEITQLNSAITDVKSEMTDYQTAVKVYPTYVEGLNVSRDNWYKVGNSLYFNMQLGDGGSWAGQIATLPDDCIPSNTQYFSVAATGTQTGDNYMVISVNGTASLYTTHGGSYALIGGVCLL